MDQVSVTWLAACSSWPPFTQLSDTTLSLDDVLSKPLISTLSLEPQLHFHWLWPVHRPPPAGGVRSRLGCTTQARETRDELKFGFICGFPILKMLISHLY